MEKGRITVASSKETQKKQQPLFTVGIVTFRQRHLLNECLDSVFEQTYSNIELIVLDDHSCDFDSEEVQGYIEKHKGENIKSVRVIQNEKIIGTVQNCAKAMELSHGVYVKLHAGDDTFSDSEALEAVQETFEEKNAKIVFSRALGMTQQGELTQNIYPADYCFAAAKNATAKELFDLIGTHCWGAFVCVPAVFWRRDFYCEMGGYDTAHYLYTVDWPMWLEVCKKGVKPFYYDRVTVHYRYGGISNSQPEQNLIMAKAHYLESARMLYDAALPEYQKSHDHYHALRCRQAAKSLEARATAECDWPYMSILQKLKWRLCNLPYYIDTFLIRSQDGRMPLPFKKAIIALFALWLLYQLDLDLLPWLPDRAVWSIFTLLILVAAVILGTVRAISLGLYFLRKLYGK